MKKLMVCALCAMVGLAASAAASQYHVYKFTLNAKTTAAKGMVTTSCGDEYAYRDKGNVKIEGILAGCGCEAIQANGVCDNAILYMWDATHKIAITNVEVMVPWTVQRIGKKQNVVEHYARFRATYGADDEYSFDIVMSGFGKYNENTKDLNLSYCSSFSGNFAGIATAPRYLKVGKCSACSYEPDEEHYTLAFPTCEECGSGVTSTYEFTPFGGTYSMSYNSDMSKRASKNGLANNPFKLPSYVSAFDYVATNIGE